MLFALAIPFMEVILHTAMAWLRQKHEWKNTKEVVDMDGSNQIDEIYGAEPRTHIATSGVKVGPHENVIKGLIKEAIKEAVSSAGTTNDQDQQGGIEIVAKERKKPIMRKIGWDQKDESTWTKKVIRYFVHYFKALFSSGFLAFPKPYLRHYQLHLVNLKPFSTFNHTFNKSLTKENCFIFKKNIFFLYTLFLF